MESMPITRIGLMKTPTPGSICRIFRKVASVQGLDACPAVTKADFIRGQILRPERKVR
jgi:hypothetical protein